MLTAPSISAPPASDASGITHDIFNQGSVILAAMDLVDLDKMSRADFRKLVVTRTTAILELARKFTIGPVSGTMRPRFDVNKSVIKVEGDFVCFPRAVTFCSSYEPTSLRVNGDHTEFERALINIIENACSAVAQSEDPQIKLTAKAGTDFIEVIIADNGHGMNEATRLRIFDSGFTTKTQRPNHGLGLAITAKIVAELGGTVTCESEFGNGAAFRIRLPAS
jgi:signal transduction histidine kinase